MQSIFPCWQARSIAVLAVLLFNIARPARSAEPLPEAGVKAAPVSQAAVDGKSPAPIFVIPGPNGLTIESEDLQALDEFEQLLATAANAAGNGPMAVFYLKHAKAQDVADDLDKILSGGASLSDSSSASSSLSASRRALATGPVKITPETRLNALLVLANRSDQNTVERLLKILDRESPDDIAVSPKPRMIPVEHARAKDIADVLRQVYADRLVLTLSESRQQSRAAGRGGALLPMLMQGMGGGGRGGGGGRNGGQNQRDAANRIAIGVDTRTNNLIIAATDPLFTEVKQLVQQLDLAAAAENETVRVVTLHRTSATAVERALEAFGGDAVQTTSTSTSAPANGSSNPNSSSPPWASRGFGGMNGGSTGGQRSMGNNRPAGGSFSPFQGFGNQRGSRYSQPGRPGQ